jgi:hypothetical protein
MLNSEKKARNGCHLLGLQQPFHIRGWKRYPRPVAGLILAALLESPLSRLE